MDDAKREKIKGHLRQQIEALREAQDAGAKGRRDEADEWVMVASRHEKSADRIRIEDEEETRGKLGGVPPRAILRRGGGARQAGQALMERKGKALEAMMGGYGTKVEVVRTTVGPTVCQYEIKLGEGTRVSDVTRLQRDIALQLGSNEVRLIGVIEGKSAMGIEVPMVKKETVLLGDVMAETVKGGEGRVLNVPLGRDVAGKAMRIDIGKTPHLLVAGATGSGKSVFLQSLISGLVMEAGPADVRLILVDPKRVEMVQWAGLPHLLTGIVTESGRTLEVMDWLIGEMEGRYRRLGATGARDIDSANAKGAGMAKIVVVIDELNDLMMDKGKELEERIMKLAQKSRAVGIHLVLATQRPSVNVITGVIKANLPSRIAFAVSSGTDSRVILDKVGAEKLSGAGDALVSLNEGALVRVQGCWVSDEEIDRITGYWKLAMRVAG